MTLTALRRLAWLSVLLWFAVWLATAGPLFPDWNGAPARLIVPDPNAPEFLI